MLDFLFLSVYRRLATASSTPAHPQRAQLCSLVSARPLHSSRRPLLVPTALLAGTWQDTTQYFATRTMPSWAHRYLSCPAVVSCRVALPHRLSLDWNFLLLGIQLSLNRRPPSSPPPSRSLSPTRPPFSTQTLTEAFAAGGSILRPCLAPTSKAVLPFQGRDAVCSDRAKRRIK